MLSFSIRFSAPSIWMGGGLDSRCLVRVYGAGMVPCDCTAPSGVDDCETENSCICRELEYDSAVVQPVA